MIGEQADVHLGALRLSYPGVTGNDCPITSPEDAGYNCVSWALEMDSVFYWPFPHAGRSRWPVNVPRRLDCEAFALLFIQFGYEPCAHPQFIPGLTTLAIYGRPEKLTSSYLQGSPTQSLELARSFQFRHAARQTSAGNWTSKLGYGFDFSHPTAESLTGPGLGQIVMFLSRAHKT